MIFLPPFSLFLLVFLALLLPVLFFLLPLRLFQVALRRLGISPAVAAAVFWASLLGGLINVPVARVAGPGEGFSLLPPAAAWALLVQPAAAEGMILAVNIGGAVIPVLICLYLAGRAPLFRTLLLAVFMTWLCHRVARPVPGVGITIPALLPPAAAIIGAFILSPRNRAPVAYISGVVGVLVGADLLHLPGLPYYEGVMSIGGAGVFDGIFLVGVLAALFA